MEIRYSYAHVPTVREFAASNARVRGLMGPFRSGKSSGCVVEIVRRAQAQRPGPDGMRRTRWLVVRNCFDDQTEILTERRGWQLFKDLLPEDKVATLKGGKTLTYEIPSYYYSAHHKGEMIGLQSDGLDLLVTPDHRLWTSKRSTRRKAWQPYSHETASAAYGRTLRRMKRDAEWNQGAARYSEDFYEFIGFWFAEGYAGAYRYADRAEPHWRFVVVQKRGLGYVRDLLTRAGLRWGETLSKTSGCTYFRIKIAPELKPLVSELARLGHAPDKNMPLWLKDSPAAHARAFLKGYITGDGSFANGPGGVTRASTSSKRLADDIQELGLKAGYVVNVGKSAIPRQRGAFKSNSTHAYRMTFLAKSRSEPTARGWYRAAYDGMVYCVEVSSHVVLVRRNGKTVWCGQTFGQLEDTTMKTTHMWLPPSQFGRHYTSDHRYVVKGFQGVEFEILFRALDKPEHVANLLSLEVTGAWINEAREVPWAIVDAIQGRIEQYPSKQMGGCTWGGLFMDTNPPDQDSDWFRFFEEKKHPGWFAKIFRQPSGLGPNAENIPNLTNPNYYKMLAQGKKPEWIKVYCDGEYGFVVDGKPVYDEYSDQLHRKAVDPVPGVPVRRGWDFGLCYDDQTEVLTDSGWKLFKNVDETKDLAATRNPATGAMEYAPIAFKISKPFKGEMLEWSSTELNLCITPDHRVPFTYRDSPGVVHWQSAEWLAQHMSGHHYVDLCSTWQPTDPEGRYLGMEPMIFAELVGLYLAEGSTSKGRITIYQKTKRADMQRILDATGIPWRWRDSPKASGWRVTDRKLALFLRSFGTAKTKTMPLELRLFPAQHLRAFINAYTLGDGHVRQRANGSHEHTIFTTSERMASDLQDVIQKAGWNSSLRKVKPQASNYRGRIIRNAGGYSITVKKRATRAELFKRNFHRVPYDGMVYCLNVPHHTLYVRRKGKPSWNGNTPACCFSQVLPDGRWLVFDEMRSMSMGFDQFSDDVLEHCRRSFRGANVQFLDDADPAGDQRAQTDKRTCFDIAATKGIEMTASVQDPTLRMESVRKPLRTLINTGSGGEPQFVLHPRCKSIRKGFLGGYNLRKIQVAGPERFASRPDKGPYSHIMNALEYTAAQLFAPALTAGLTSSGGTDWPDTGYGPGQGDEGRSEVTGY